MQPFMPPIISQPFNVQSPGPQAFVTWQPQSLLPQIGLAPIVISSDTLQKIVCYLPVKRDFKDLGDRDRTVCKNESLILI